MNRGKFQTELRIHTKEIPKASPFRFTNHSDMYKIDGVYEKHAPIPKATPWAKMSCVVLEAKELIAKETQTITMPTVETQRASRGIRIIIIIVKGASKYAIPCFNR